MINNLRSKSIEGHISDSAGNILRNASIVIKQSTPNGTYVVNTIQSDDDGYFISTPLPNGVYDIYESGTKISRVIHTPDTNKIQCFKANKDNYDLTIIDNFSTDALNHTLNNYKSFIQLESPLIDVYQYGNIFPIYDVDLLTIPGLDEFYDLYYLQTFFKFNSNSRITTTRFDVEYFSPLTASFNTYKRIRWAGVPAIRFYKDSRLVIPLDYYSISANKPKSFSDSIRVADAVIMEEDSPDVMTISETTSKGKLYYFSKEIVVGDILKVKMTNETNDGVWWGIVNNITLGDSDKAITMERWKSSRFVSDSLLSGTVYVTRIFAFDGMFSSIMDINEDTNERFSVFENISVQSDLSELYNYSDQ